MDNSQAAMKEGVLRCWVGDRGSGQVGGGMRGGGKLSAVLRCRQCGIAGHAPCVKCMAIQLLMGGTDGVAAGAHCNRCPGCIVAALLGSYLGS